MNETTVAAPEAVLPTTKRGWWIVLLIIGVALIGRVGLVAMIQGDYVPQTDALQFDQLATSLANGDGFGQAPQPPMIGPTALRAPLYPIALASVYVVFGDHAYTAALLVNALLGTIAVGLVGLVASQLMGRRVGATAMGLTAVYPAMYLTGSSLQLEPMLVVLCLGALAAALEHRRRKRSILWPVVAGLCIGLGMLTREQAAFFAPLIAWLVWTADRPRPSLRDKVGVRSVVLAGLAALVIAPWTIRNYRELDEFVPITTSSGFGLIGTYNETSRNDRGQWLPPYNDPASARLLLDIENPTEVRVDSALRDASIELIKDHPTYVVEVAFWNLVRGFDLDGGTYTRTIAPFLPYPQRLLDPAIASGWLLLLAAACGAFTLRVRRSPLAVWVLPVALIGFMVVFLPFSIRYRALLEPFSLFLAASFLVTAHDWWRRSGGTLWTKDLAPAVAGGASPAATTPQPAVSQAPVAAPAAAPVKKATKKPPAKAAVKKTAARKATPAKKAPAKRPPRSS